MEYLIERIKTLDQHDEYQLNARIDNIFVIIISRGFDDNYYLQVKSNNIFETIDLDDFNLINLYHYYIRSSNYSEIAEKFVNHINNLKFDKLIGKFVLQSTENSDSKTIINDTNDVLMEMKLFPQLFKDNECSVCLEKTTTKTYCNHSLCYICWEKYFL